MAKDPTKQRTYHLEVIGRSTDEAARLEAVYDYVRAVTARGSEDKQDQIRRACSDALLDVIEGFE